MEFLDPGNLSPVNSPPQNNFNPKRSRRHHPFKCLLNNSPVGNPSFKLPYYSFCNELGREFGIFNLIDFDVDLKVLNFLFAHLAKYLQDIFFDVLYACPAAAYNHTRAAYGNSYDHAFWQSFNLDSGDACKFKFLHQSLPYFYVLDEKVAEYPFV